LLYFCIIELLIFKVSAEKIYQNKYLPVAKYLLKELEYYGENQFKRKTAASDWTIGQLYHHLIQGTHDNHIKSIRNCLDHKGGYVKGRKTLVGYYLFAVKSYPPFVKFKNLPEYSPAQIENIAKAKDMMYGIIKEMQKLAIEIDKKNDQKYKIKHRKFGRLTALEWYNLIAIHQIHHLKQKRRIDKILRTFVKDEVYNDPAVIS
jgi:hypothetical protein